MLHSTPHLHIKAIASTLFLGVLFVSCGSYQAASYYDNDGIYGSTEDKIYTEQPQQTKKTAEPNVYTDYFGQKADQYAQILDSEVFTDVDDYYGEVESDSLTIVDNGTYFDDSNDYNSYAGWGDNATNVSINIYDNPNWGNYGWGGAWGWNSWGWNTWGWNGYYGGYNGFYNPYWAWGGYYGYYSPWSYRYGFYRPLRYGYAYSPYYYKRYNRYNQYAYNNSRRAYTNRNTVGNSSLRGRTNTTASSRYRTTSTRSNANTSSRRVVSADGVSENRAYRTSRATRAVPKYNSSSRSTQAYRRSTGTTGRQSSTYSPSYSTSRSSSRSTTTTTRSATTPSRSSYRSSSSGSTSRSYSSGSSTRSSSSGTRSSSAGRSSGGRRN